MITISVAIDARPGRARTLVVTMNQDRQRTAADRPGGQPPGTVRSEDLFRESNQLKIVHNQEIYTLRITANDKLILTK
jgi:hemin uptake protein HemP